MLWPNHFLSKVVEVSKYFHPHYSSLLASPINFAVCCYQFVSTIEFVLCSIIAIIAVTTTIFVVRLSKIIVIATTKPAGFAFIIVIVKLIIAVMTTYSPAFLAVSSFDLVSHQELGT